MLIDYHILHQPPIPPLPQSCLFQYIVGKDGVYLRFEREGMKGCIPLASCEIRGLEAVEPYLALDYPPVPVNLVSRMLELARQSTSVKEGSSLEILFYLVWETDKQEWQLIVPEQVQRQNSVRPKDPTNEAYRVALIESHSHHCMAAFFSSTDDADEQGLKFYCVLGNIFDKPQIAVRLGIYGQFFPLPASTILTLPPEVEDAFFSEFKTSELLCLEE